jgi:DNA-binding NarL/FixJ family response regulator
MTTSKADSRFSLYTATRFKTEARYRFGADGYLTKPLKFGVLKAALDLVAPISRDAWATYDLALSEPVH